MKTFKLVRYVTIGSIAFFIFAIAVLAFFLRQNGEANLLDMAEQNNTRLSRLFAKTADTELQWMFSNPTLTYDQNPDFDRFYKQVQANMDGLQVLKVKIFTPIGLTVFSTQVDQIGDDKSTNGGFVSAMKGVPKSELTHRDTFSAFEQEVEDKDVISSYIPIYFEGSAAPVGVFEIYSDVTPLLLKIEQEQLVVLALAAGLFILLWGGLFVVIQRADKKLQAQVEENQKSKLQLANSEKLASLGEMVAGISHELNTPIAFVQSNLSLMVDTISEIAESAKLGSRLTRLCHGSEKDIIRLKMNANSVRSKTPSNDMDIEPEELRELVEQSLSGITLMSELVKNLKEFTRVDRTRTDSFDLNHGLDNVHYIVRSVIPENVVIKKEFGPIPTIECMASQINQVFLNLIQNAAHAGATEVTLKSEAIDGQVCISIIDNGSGISDDVLPNIFDSFYTTKDREKGTGLGLYISKDIVESHGGDIEVETEIGKGTTFRVWLPTETPDVISTAA